MEINREIKNITSAFVLEDNLTECIPYGSGHINDTYRLTYDTGKHYILQKMNRSIFTKPVELMENVSGVTAWLKKKIQENGGDVERETLNLVMTKDGLPYYVDEDGEYWRVYLFIENATCYDMVKDEEDFYQSAVAFGHFQRLLADYPAETLHETIVNFHNTVDRLDKFKTAVEKDICHRAADVYRNMFQLVDAVCMDDNMDELAKQVDVIFTATPQGLCASLVNEEILSNTKIVDLSADFRLKDVSIYEQWYKLEHKAPQYIDEAVYGLCEINRNQIDRKSVV